MSIKRSRLDLSGDVAGKELFVSFPQVTTTNLGTPSGAGIVFDSTTASWKEYNSSTAAWGALGGGGATPTADNVYNNGAWTVTGDANDVIFNLVAAYNVKLSASATGSACVLETDNAAGTATASILCSATAAVTTAIDASAANITNAISVGDNTILGGAGVINFTAFDVDASGNVTCNDLTVGGTFSAATFTVTGSLTAGSSGSGIDVIFHTGTAGDEVTWDSSERTMLFDDCKIHLQDNDEQHFGAGSAVGTGDFKMYSDGTHLYIAAVADNASQALYLGDDTNDLDVIWEGDTNAAIVQFDSSTNQVEFNGADLRLQDDDILQFGDGATTNGDFKISCDGTDLFIQANANVASQAIKIGDATSNDVDVIIYGVTSGDYFQLDSSADQLLLVDINLVATETGNTSVADFSGAATGIDVVSITGSGALTDNFAVLRVDVTGNIAAGGCGIMVEALTGTAVEDSRLLEIKGAGKLARGVYADVDPVANDAYVFHSGGATATGKSVMRVSADGAPAAATAHILEVDGSNGTWGAVNCVPFSVLNSGTGACAVFENTVTGALGAQIILHHNPAAEADNDVCGRIQFIGSDAAHADENAARIDVIMRDETAANPDFDMLFYVDVAGTETLRLELPYDLNGILAGSGAADAYVSSAGDNDLILKTGNATSGSITIADGAAGALTLAPNTTGEVIVLGADVGALGAVLRLKHDPSDGTAANDDVVARIQFEGQQADETQEPCGRIDCIVRDITDGAVVTDVLFYTDVAGAETLQMELNNYGVAVGTGAAAGVVTSAGTQDLKLDTNGGTNSGSITITDAANGNITLDPNGTGRVAVVGAALANGTAHSAVPQLILMPYVAGSFDVSDDLTLFNANSPKMKVIDVWLDNDTAEGGALTLTVRDAAAGAGNVIATAIDANATTILHAATLTTTVLAANSSVVVHASANPANAIGTIYVMYIEVA